MTLSNDDTLAFIEDYRSFSFLWDVKDKYYVNKMKRLEALRALGQTYSLDVAGVKKKIKSLRSYFSKEQQRVLSKNSGSGDEGNYSSPWFAYNSLSFIADTITPRERKETRFAWKQEVPENGISYEILIQEDENTPLAQPQSISRKQNLKSKKAVHLNRKIIGQKAHTYLKKGRHKVSRNNEYGIFGEMVAAKLSKFSKRNQIIAQNYISNYLFKIELEELNHSPSMPPPYGLIQPKCARYCSSYVACLNFNGHRLF